MGDESQRTTVVVLPGQAPYEACRDVRLCWPLVGFAVLYNAISVPGMAMNLGVIWVTFRTSTLRGTTNFLLALYSFFEMLNESGNLLFLWTALSPSHFVDYGFVVHVLALPYFGLFASTMAMAFTGFDRFLAVFFPFKYKWMKPVPYLGAICLTCASYSLAVFAFSFCGTERISTRPVTGSMLDMYQADVTSSVTIVGFAVLNATTIALYVLLGAKLWLRKQESATNEEETQRRLFRSLFCILALNIGGYSVTSVAFIVFRFAQINSAFALWYLYNFAGVLASVSAASNGPILHFTSDEYRKAFHRFIFVRLNLCTSLKSQIVKELLLVSCRKVRKNQLRSVSRSHANGVQR